MSELTEAEKQAILDDLDASTEAYSAHQARMNALREMCLAAKRKHYQQLYQRKRNER